MKHKRIRIVVQAGNKFAKVALRPREIETLYFALKEYELHETEIPEKYREHIRRLEDKLLHVYNDILHYENNMETKTWAVKMPRWRELWLDL